MKMMLEDHDQLTVMTFDGDITVDDVAKLRKAASQRLDDHVRDFVLDVSEVEFIDSQGLETLLWLQDTCAENLGQIRLASPTENVSTILRLTRLASHLACHDGVDAAIKSLR